MDEVSSELETWLNNACHIIQSFKPDEEQKNDQNDFQKVLSTLPKDRDEKLLDVGRVIFSECQEEERQAMRLI